MADQVNESPDARVEHRLTVPLLGNALRGAYLTPRSILLCAPLVLALILSFLDVRHYLPIWYSRHLAERELRARLVTAIWMVAAVVMSFLFSLGTLRNVLEIAKSAPSTLRADDASASAKEFWAWLARSQRLAQLLVATFIALSFFALYPNPIVQEWTIIITGVPLVLLISYSDFAMYRAFQCAEACTFKPEEKRDVARLRRVLGDSGRLLVYVDAPVLVGLSLISILKVYWHYHSPGLEPLYIVGFTGGAIAMHLVLGNLISLLFEYFDRVVFVAE